MAFWLNKFKKCKVFNFLNASLRDSKDSHRHQFSRPVLTAKIRLPDVGMIPLQPLFDVEAGIARFESL
jgi:hypothetical protein